MKSEKKMQNRMGALSATELLASYLSLLTGTGSGTGWDKGEEAAAAKSTVARTEPSGRKKSADVSGALRGHGLPLNQIPVASRSWNQCQTLR
jgi:hypothetical protein